MILSKEHKTGSVDESQGKDHKRIQEMPRNPEGKLPLKRERSRLLVLICKEIVCYLA